MPRPNNRNKHKSRTKPPLTESDAWKEHVLNLRKQGIDVYDQERLTLKKLNLR